MFSKTRTLRLVGIALIAVAGGALGIVGFSWAQDPAMPTMNGVGATDSITSHTDLNEKIDIFRDRGVSEWVMEKGLMSNSTTPFTDSIEDSDRFTRGIEIQSGIPKRLMPYLGPNIPPFPPDTPPSDELPALDKPYEGFPTVCSGLGPLQDYIQIHMGSE